MGLLGLFATFIAVTAYLGKIFYTKYSNEIFHEYCLESFLGDVYRALRDAGSSASGLYINMAILLAALCFAGFHKLQRSL